MYAISTLPGEHFEYRQQIGYENNCEVAHFKGDFEALKFGLNYLRGQYPFFTFCDRYVMNIALTATVQRIAFRVKPYNEYPMYFEQFSHSHNALTQDTVPGDLVKPVALTWVK